LPAETYPEKFYAASIFTEVIMSEPPTGLSLKKLTFSFSSFSASA